MTVGIHMVSFGWTGGPDKVVHLTPFRPRPVGFVASVGEHVIPAVAEL